MPGGVGLRPGLKWVNCLLVDEEDRFLYAGVKVGAQLWRFDGEGWEQVGGLGRDSDWLAEDQDNVYSMAWHDGGLMVGIRATSRTTVCQGMPTIVVRRRSMATIQAWETVRFTA